MEKIQIIIASPSPVARSRIVRALSSVSECEVVAQVADLSQAFNETERMEPDIIMIAKGFCDAEEFHCMRSLFYALGTRFIKILDGSVHSSHLAQVQTAEGVICEPFVDPGMTGSEMLAQCRLLATIRRDQSERQAPLTAAATRGKKPPLVVIGASTGGIDALLAVLSEFPADCPPTAVVQHTGQGFSESLIRLFARRSAATVVAARDNLVLKPGMICIAGGSPGHLLVRSGDPYVCQLRDGAPVSGHKPSVDELFRSALPLAPDVVGVILTGMGQDGATGLLALRKAGCVTIGQDAASATVYGMPKVAWEMGAVQTQLPISRIGGEILAACGRIPQARIAAQ